MKAYIKISVIFLTLLIWAGFTLVRSSETSAQNQPSQFPTGNRQQAEFPTSVNLECAGCHGPGKTLPNIGGEKFHKDAHAAMATSIHSRSRNGNGPIAECKTCHTINGDMTTILPAENPKSTINRANIAETCGKCHGDKQVMQGSGITDRPLLAYRESVHARAIDNGNVFAAVCTDCHTSHNVLPASNADSSIAKANIPQTCGKCHGRESEQFISSVHGQAVMRGVSRSPSCTDCHGIHYIQQPYDHNTSVATTAVATDSCSGCHEGVVLTKEFGVAGGRVTSYKDSYHGMASKLGSKVVANCASCHGVHNILPSSDPRSMINSNNLAQTCSQCHIGASEKFISGRIHMVGGLVAETPPAEDPAIFGTNVVRWIYLPLIFLTIGGMVLHNVLVWRKKAAAKLHQKREIVRLSANQRAQHWLLLTSFLVLVVSGFALEYPDTWLGWITGSSEQTRRIIHRIAAVLMMVTGVYHILYLAFSKEGRRWVADMLPTWKDVKDLAGNFGYYLGLRRDRPKIRRFGYVEKAEYWAVVWGTVIMGLTGLMIWYKIEMFGFLPRWWIEIAIAIHFYEAVLATLAILVWHFYSVIFDPDVYPINFAFLDGRVSEDEFKEEHELAYEEMKNARGEDEPAGGDISEGEPRTAT